MIEDVFLPTQDAAGNTDATAPQDVPDLIDRNLSNFIPLLNMQQSGTTATGGQQ